MFDEPAALEAPVSLASLNDLSTFRLTRLLRADKDVTHILGTFTPHPTRAILTLRPTKLSTKLVSTLIDSFTAAASTAAAAPPPRLILRHANDIYYSFISPSAVLPCHIDIQYPADDKLVASLSSHDTDVLLLETAHLYTTVHLPYIQQQLASPNHLAWLYNILAGSSETDRIIVRCNDYVAVAQPEWDLHSLDTLHVLVIPHTRTITSLRALNAAHLPLLAAMRRGVLQALRERCGEQCTEEQLLMYVHYPPSFYHLHVHVQHVSVTPTVGSAVNRAVDLYDIEQQLQRDGRWYEQCSIRCRVPGGHVLAEVARQQSQRSVISE